MLLWDRILYGREEHPDHVVVIKYVPYVGDSKRAMDEYTSEIFMGGKVSEGVSTRLRECSDKYL